MFWAAIVTLQTHLQPRAELNVSLNWQQGNTSHLIVTVVQQGETKKDIRHIYCLNENVTKIITTC